MWFFEILKKPLPKLLGALLVVISVPWALFSIFQLGPLETILEDTRSDLAICQTTASSARAELSEISRECVRRAEYDARNEEIAHLRNQLENLKAVSVSEGDYQNVLAASEQSGARVGELNLSTARLEKENAVLREKNANLNQDIGRLSKRLSEIGENERIVERIAALESQRANFTIEVGNLSRDLERIRGEAGENREECLACKEKSRCDDSEILYSCANAGSLEGQADEIQRQLDWNVNRYESLTSDIQNLETRLVVPISADATALPKKPVESPRSE